MVGDLEAETLGFAMKIRFRMRLQDAFPFALRLGRRAVPLAALTCALTVRTASAQVLFSIDYRGPTIGIPGGPCFPGLPITAGDILTPMVPPFVCALGTPSYGPPFPPPIIVVPGGPLGLGVPSIGACAFVPPGAPCPAELDALSLGMDYAVPPGTLPAGTYVFSVDEWAVGIPGSPLFSVFSEGTTFGVFDGATDVFEALAIPPSPLPFPPLALFPGNTGLIDGNRIVSLSGAHYAGLGLIEPSPPVFVPGPRPGDNLDALDIDVPVLPLPAVVPYYYSLDAAFFDPLAGTPNLGTAAANFGGVFAPGDVISTVPPLLYAAAPALGLDFFGFGTDDLDALAIAENGVPGFAPSPGPYAWGPGTPFDMLLFSVRRGSAITVAPPFVVDSLLGIPIEPGDILIPPVVGGLSPFPGIFIPAEYLGLATVRSALVPFGDDLDALDTRIPAATGVRFCHGDGDTPCPCPPVGAPGNGCPNSVFPGGASLAGTGIASVAADSVVLTASSMSGALCVFYQGTLTIAPFAGDDGLSCVGGAVIRVGTEAIVGGAAIRPGPGDPLLSVSGAIPAIGGTRFYQVFYRNAAAFFCPPATSNRTNGFMIVWAP